MAKPTDEQIKKLEADHKTQFANLAQAGRFRIMLSDKFGINSKAFKDYNAIFVPLANKWAARQLKLEKGGVPKMNIDLTSFSTRGGIARAETLLKQMDKEGKGIGFIPLLIWAVILLAGFFTADQIVDEINNTAEEQTQLIKATGDVCKANNLDVEDCKKLITQQTDAVSNDSKKDDGIFSGITGKLFGLAVAFLVISNLDKITNAFKK